MCGPDGKLNAKQKRDAFLQKNYTYLNQSMRPRQSLSVKQRMRCVSVEKLTIRLGGPKMFARAGTANCLILAAKNPQNRIWEMEV